MNNNNNSFYYKIGNIECNTPWDRPTKTKLLELMNYFNNNFPKAHLFKISLHGGFHSSESNKTWDLDLKIHFVDINNKNFQDIYDCLYFLYYHGLNTFKILIDIKYVDTFQPTTHMLYNLAKNKQYKELETFNIYNLVGDTIDFSNIYEKKYEQEKWCTKKQNYKSIVNLNNGLQLFVIQHYPNPRIDKFKKYINNGRIYYKDLIINDSCKITSDYFNS